ncbi:MAG: flagellar hook-associated protein 3 [Rhodocyclaceae bacterium]|nr:MAG: flagellar hook-associated protein 3 [Rhodocyclaceae bacterium]
MRISTSMIYDSGVRSVQSQTSTLLHTQQQLATGRRMLSPSEDPVAAARALEIGQAKEINATYAVTQGNAKSTLSLVDSQLSAAADLITRVRELAVQAGDASLSAGDLRSISSELRAHFDELIGLANSTDGTGQYLFSGFQGSNKPFSGSVESGAVYQGDDGQRALRVSSSRNLPVSESGNNIFMNIKSGNGTFTTGAQAQRSANSSTITLDGTKVINLPTVAGTLEMRFWVDKADVLGLGAGQAFYDLVDTSNGKSIFTGTTSTTGAAGSYTNAYLSGVPIAISDGAAVDYGVTVTITGSPQTGDIISLKSDGAAVTATAKTLLPSGARATIDKGQLDPADPLAALKWSSAANSGNLELRFWTDPANASIYYDLVDGKTGISEFTGNQSATGAGGSYTQPYFSGSAISLANAGPPAFDFGATVTVSGLPATGDVFTIKTSTDATGNGSFVTAPKLAKTYNTGTGIIGTGEVLDAAKWNSTANSGRLEVRFWNDTTTIPATQYYDLVDGKTEKSLFTDTISTSGGYNNTFTHKFISGDSIPFTGLAAAYGDFGASVTISGTPASGDVFNVNTSSSESAFSTIGRLIKALEAPDNPGSNAKIALHNELGSVINNLDRALDNNLVVRAAIGSRMGELDALDGVVQDVNLQYSQTLSGLQDLDYAQAITDLTRHQTELEAAQKSFVNISRLSLFNYV